MTEIDDLKRKIRKETIVKVFEHYDGGVLGLDREKRLIKYKKMAKSPFQFFRGSAYLFYFDVSSLPLSYHTPEDKPTWLQGDLHFENFGGFRNEKGEMVFDSNDFDEGYLGSYLYDVFRMAASIGLYAEQLGYQDRDLATLIQAYLKGYYEQLDGFARREHDPTTLLFTKENTTGPVQNVLGILETHQSQEKLEQMTLIRDGRRYFKVEGAIQPLTEVEISDLKQAWPEYIRSLDENHAAGREYFHIKDAVKLEGLGTGSIGLNRYFILVEGKDENDLDDVILEAKEARYPATGYYFSYDDLFLPDAETSLHHGRRVIRTQKAMHYLQDPYLGFFTIGNRHYYVRENSSYDEGIDPELLHEPESMMTTVDTMSKVTAKIHARADHDVDERLPHDSETEILKAIGDFKKFSDDLVHLALFYKNQVNEDYQLFKQWLEDEFV